MSNLLDAEALLAGPRGRRLCLAIAHRLHQPVWSALFDAAGNPNDGLLISRLAAELDHVDVTRLSDWSDATHFVSAVAETVNAAMYWQSPDEEDLISSGQPVLDSLAPVALAICSSKATTWWTEAIDLGRIQYSTQYDYRTKNNQTVRLPLDNTAKKLDQWRIDVNKGSKQWWTAPLGYNLISTTRPLGCFGPAGLVWQEDSLNYSAARVWDLVAESPRIYEVDSTSAWTALVESNPLEVTSSRGGSWDRILSREGRWFIPDYKEVAREWDGIHLSVAAYLSSATRALPLSGGGQTLLAGWNPDTTWWLQDAVQSASTRPEVWHRRADANDYMEWVPTSFN